MYTRYSGFPADPRFAEFLLRVAHTKWPRLTKAGRQSTARANVSLPLLLQIQEEALDCLFKE